VALTVVITPNFWTSAGGATRESRAVILRDGIEVDRIVYTYQQGEHPLTPTQALRRLGYKATARLRQSRPSWDVYGLGNKGPDALAPQNWHGEVVPLP
jgi:hypothetical protein